MPYVRNGTAETSMTTADRSDAPDDWFEDPFDDDSTWDEQLEEAKRRSRLTSPVDLPDDVLTAFAASPEARALEDPSIDAPRIVLRLAAQEYDLTLTTLRWYDLREVVFDSVPYAQAIAPLDARRFVDEVLAFTHYLMRIGTPPHAEEWLRVFDQYAAEDLADIVGARPRWARRLAKQRRNLRGVRNHGVALRGGMGCWKTRIGNRRLPGSTVRWRSVPRRPGR